MRSLRAFLRFTVLIWWSALFLLPGALARISCRRIEYGARLTRLWARGCLKLLGGRVEVTGGPIPAGGGLIVSNHLGYLDIMVHASLFKVRFAPKIEMKRWPLVGCLTGFSNPVWIDRRRRRRAGEAALEMCAALREDVPLLVYPEGTSGDGAALLPFKSTCFSAAIATGARITPLLISYDPTDDGTVLPWFGNAALLPHIWRVMGLKEFCCHVYIMEEFNPESDDRKMLASSLHDLMEKHYRRWIENA